jgi:DNA (cytosine-5)-methyltransferase 1
MTGGLIVDLFAGGGGASTGIRAALGRDVDIAINHSPVAMAVHRRNHPETRHYEADVWEVRPLEATGGKPVDLLWLSPDCKHFSNAKGAVPLDQYIRSLAWVGIRWAKAVRPRVIMLENVREFEGWGPLGDDGKPDKPRKGHTFRQWTGRLRALGYAIDWRVLDASQYGAPTRRKRLFLIARRDGQPIVWPEPTHGPGRLPLRSAAECIDWDIPCPSIFERRRPLKPKTLWRIAQGMRRFVFECPQPFIIQVAHGKREARGEQLSLPLSTVTASRRTHGLAVPILQQSGWGERIGQRARVLDLDQPLTTVVADGQKHALVAAFIHRFYGGPKPVIGSRLEAPLPTVTPWDHNSLAAVYLAKFRGTHADQPAAASVLDPMPTISAGGIHVGEVRAFLTAYFGNDGTTGQSLRDPMRTITTKHRLGIVTVGGRDYQVSDIGFRMLVAEELHRAQFGRFAAGHDLSPARTQANKVWCVGNSVCPELAEQLIAANMPWARRAAA